MNGLIITALIVLFVIYLEVKCRELEQERQNDTGEREGCDREHD